MDGGNAPLFCFQTNIDRKREQARRNTRRACFLLGPKRSLLQKKKQRNSSGNPCKKAPLLGLLDNTVPVSFSGVFHFWILGNSFRSSDCLKNLQSTSSKKHRRKNCQHTRDFTLPSCRSTNHPAARLLVDTVVPLRPYQRRTFFSNPSSLAPDKILDSEFPGDRY